MDEAAQTLVSRRRAVVRLHMNLFRLISCLPMSLTGYVVQFLIYPFTALFDSRNMGFSFRLKTCCHLMCQIKCSHRVRVPG